jgi:hypothetical protein
MTANVPRLDYLGSSCPSLLLEPQRTNLALFSETFNNDTGWFPSGRPAVTSNVGISPSGYQDADLLTFASGNSLRTQSSFTFTNAYTYSIFVKKDVGRYVTIAGLFFTRNLTVGFDLDTKTAQAGGTITDYGNGWLRLSISQVVTGDPDTTGFFYVYAPNTLGGNSSGDGNSLYAWGCQIEDSTYPTSYIPTLGTSVTRVADAASKTGISSLIGQTQGTIYFEAQRNNSDADYRIQISDGTTNNWLFVGIETGLNIRAYANVGGANQFSAYSISPVSNATHKIAIAYANNDVKVYVDGIALITITSGSIPATSRLDIGSSSPANVAVTPSLTSQLLLFKTRLSNTELEQLTTL